MSALGLQKEAAPVLALQHISFDYAASRDAPPVVEDTSLELRRGEVVSIIGPSGCGKSTLLTIAAGLVKSGSGRVLVDGREATGQAGHVGFMMQRDELFPWRTVLENVLLGLEVVEGGVRPEDEDRAMQLLNIAGLTGYENHYPSALSGGMRQRAAFVRTLMLGRPVVLLDEPFGALDAITRSEMQGWLLKMRAELDQTLLMVTHDIDEAIYLSDRILVMSARPGRISLTVDIPFKRPRRYEDIVARQEFGQLKSQLLLAIHPSPSS